MAMTEENGRAFAVMQNEIKHLREEIERLRNEIREERAEDRQRQQEMQSEFKWLSTQIVQLGNDHLGRISSLEKKDVQADERWAAHQQVHTRQTGLLAGLSAALSSIATIIGIFFGKP